MKKIAFCGTTNLAGRCLQHLLNNYRDEAKVEVVLTELDISNVWWKDHDHIPLHIAKAHGIPVFGEQSALLNYDLDVGFSILYYGIFKDEIINHFNDVMINLHTAPVPKYRGCNPFSHALINGDTTYATTLHLIDVGIDTGSVIDSKEYAVKSTTTARELYDYCMEKAFEQFCDNLQDMLRGSFCSTPQPKSEHLYYSRKELDKYRDVTKKITKAIDGPSAKDLFDNVRGLEFPPFLPAHIKLSDGKKIYLITNPEKFRGH